MKTDISVDFDITLTNFAGLTVIFCGIISLFTVKDPGFASTCIVTGSGLVAAAKVANTYYDTKGEVSGCEIPRSEVFIPKE